MISLPDAWRAELIAAADAAHPAEACGLILGRTNGWAADQLVACDNVADNPAREFEIDPAALLHWYKTLRGTERAVIGVYHSHPTGVARPSATDAARAWDPDLVWLIVAGEAITAWQPADGGFAPLELTWEKP
ncbi:MAG: M67 family metallopeptidase [Alphaproteobacteria bacterium]